VPLSWGGDKEPENLQPLCEECNAGKHDYFRSFEAHAEQIRAAIGYDEPQKRIGELLRAFNGGWVRSDLLGIVASAKASRRTGNAVCVTCASWAGTTSMRSGMTKARGCGRITA
jgi:HNH endonuclease